MSSESPASEQNRGNLHRGSTPGVPSSTDQSTYPAFDTALPMAGGRKRRKSPLAGGSNGSSAEALNPPRAVSEVSDSFAISADDGIHPPATAKSEKRAAQLREAQRQYRQRKNELTKSLQSELNTVSAELQCARERISKLESELNANRCSACGDAIRQKDIAEAEASKLRAEVVQLRGEIDILRHVSQQQTLQQPAYRPEPIAESAAKHGVSNEAPRLFVPADSPASTVRSSLEDGSAGGLENRSASAFDDATLLHYEQVTTESVEQARAELQALPSLRNSSHLHAMLNTFLLSSKTKKDLKKMLISRYRMLNECNLLDTQRALEIMEKYVGTYDILSSVTECLQSGNERKTASSASPMAEPAPIRVTKNEVQPLLPDNPFSDALKTIESLKPHGDLIVQFRLAFLAQKDCNDPKRREDLYFGFLELGKKLMSLCSKEDRTKFMLAIQIAQAIHKKAVEDMVEFSEQ